MSIVKRLKNYIISEGVEINKPATAKDILAFEQQYNVKMPDDLREYFLEFNGTGEGHFGSSGYAFFSLSECRPVEESELKPEEFSIYQDCFIFCDYLNWCWGYVIKLTQDPTDNTVLSIQLENPRQLKVADSFTHFVEQYLAKPDDVIG